ncbi:helix-turn-helix domain-containing protein [Aquihabitans sp. G128]|uniref:winged helix-turn-helix transcriptional regulator n=1 Tax=Aquihabitans sp. G128 TaxID=2849779 RepID=UPI0020B33580|nr:helix-turn-helix domain-containing protein [Aquihabitans sp. G128]
MSQADGPRRLVVQTVRSGCPINITSELLGDHWSLVVLRDVMFGGRTRFRELHRHSLEGIATNVLASRLKKLTDAGLLDRRPHPEHRQGVNYFLTEAAIQLVPLMVELGSWGSRWLPAAPELARRARYLADGGDQLQAQLMDELRAIHLGHEAHPTGSGILDTLDALGGTTESGPPGTV